MATLHRWFALALTATLFATVCAACAGPEVHLTWDYTPTVRPPPPLVAAAIRAYPDDVRSLLQVGGVVVGRFYARWHDTREAAIYAELATAAARKGGTHIVKMDAESSDQVTGYRTGRNAWGGAHTSVETDVAIEATFVVYRVPEENWRLLGSALRPTPLPMPD